jgi:hypothetical protein
VADATSKVIEWSAGVSVASATLAGLIASRTHNFWFLACIIVACVSFVVLVLTGPRAVWLWWRRRRTPPMPAAARPPRPLPSLTLGRVTLMGRSRLEIDSSADRLAGEGTMLTDDAAVTARHFPGRRDLLAVESAGGQEGKVEEEEGAGGTGPPTRRRQPGATPDRGADLDPPGGARRWAADILRLARHHRAERHRWSRSSFR